MLLNIVSSGYALTKREEPLPMKTSIIIPCHFKHAPLLPILLDEYARQTVLPDEIVISLSETSLVSPEIIFHLQNHEWPFPVHLITSEMRFGDGGNRNRACRKATGDILIAHDADDLPHPQRIEIIKYLFETYNINHLGHGYIFASDHSFKLIEHPKDVEFREYGPEYAFDGIDLPIAYGPIAIHRRVFESIQWPEGFSRDNDKVFNCNVHREFKDIVVVKEPIYLYRSELTSW